MKSQVERSLLDVKKPCEFSASVLLGASGMRVPGEASVDRAEGMVEVGAPGLSSVWRCVAGDQQQPVGRGGARGECCIGIHAKKTVQ